MTARQAAEEAAAEEDRRVAGLQRAAADRREGLARLHGQVNALRSRGPPPPTRRSAGSTQARADGASPAPTGPSTTSPPSRPGSPASTRARRASTPSTRPPSALLDDLEERLAKAREEAAAGRARPRRARRPQGGARARPQPQGRRRRAARRHRLGLGPARLGRGAAHRAPRLRDRGRRGARARPPTRSPSPTSTRRSAAIDHLKDRRPRPRRAAARRRATTDDAAVARAARPTRRTPSTWSSAPTTLRPALARLLFKTAVVDDLDAARGAGRRRCPTSPR